MKRYSKVQDGQIIKRGLTLPFSEGSTSFGKNASDETLVANGYLPEVDMTQTYDSATHKVSGIRFEVVGNEIHKITDIETIDINVFKEAKRRELKNLRDEAIDEQINDVQVARVEDRENINGSIELMEANSIPSMNWVLIDNTVGTLTVSDLETIRDTYVLRKMQTFAKYGELLTVLNNATTVEEVEGIQW